MAPSSVCPGKAGAETVRRLAVRDTDANLAQAFRDASDALGRVAATKREMEKLFR